MDERRHRLARAAALALPWALRLVRALAPRRRGPAQNALLFRTVLLEVAFGMLLSAGALAARDGLGRIGAAMTDLAPVETRLEIPPEWTDPNGHMNVAYYVLAFDRATDAFYDRLGLGWATSAEGRSMFTLAMNVDYLTEIFAGETVRDREPLLDCDAKRLHYFHEMRRAARRRARGDQRDRRAPCRVWRLAERAVFRRDRGASSPR